jgi:hypothetical protein
VAEAVAPIETLVSKTLAGEPAEIALQSP